MYRTSQHLTRIICLMAAASVVSGCSALPFGPQPPVLPQASEISAPSPPANMTAADFTAYGYNQVYANCTNYFDALIKVQNQTHFGKDTLTNAGTAAAAIAAFAKASTSTVGALAAGVGFATQTINGFDTYGLVTPYPDETKSLILAALDSFSNAAPANTTINFGQAIERVQHYAELCTYSGISRFAKQALTNAKVAASGATAPDLTSLDQTEAAAIAAEMNSATPSGNVGTLSETDLAFLYWYIVDSGSQDAAKATAILKNFQSDIQSRFAKVNADGSLAITDISTIAFVPVIRPLLKAIYDRNTAFAAFVQATEKRFNGTVSLVAPSSSTSEVLIPRALIGSVPSITVVQSSK